MNKFFVWIVWTLCCSQMLMGQERDTVYLHFSLDTLKQELVVHQEFRLTNRTPKTLREVYFHAWANAYSGRLTTLNRIKLEDRKGALHFSKKQDRGGIAELDFKDQKGRGLSFEFEEREFVKINLDEVWKRGEQLVLTAEYRVEVPFDAVTKYGRSPEGNYLLKYFFLQSATMNEKGRWVLQLYQDFEELTAYPTTYFVQIDYPDGYTVFSDLEEEGDYWVATDLEHFRIYLSLNDYQSCEFQDDRTQTKVDFGFLFEGEDAAIIDSLLPSQFQFLENHLGELPSKKLFVSAKTKKEQNYVGVDDLDLGFKKLSLFSKPEQNALKLFQMLSYEYIDRLFAVNKNEDHWLKNGLQYYLLMKYVDEQFPKMKLAGHLPDEFKLFGAKPLKLFHFSKLEMNDRYKLLYLYMARQNFDQPINTRFDELSNLNQIAISGFKTGLAFYYMDQFLGDTVFADLIQNFSSQNRGKLVSQLDFRNFLMDRSPRDLSWFFDDFIDKKEKINFKLKRIDETDAELLVKVKNKTRFYGPIQLVGMKGEEAIEEKWFIANFRTNFLPFPKGDYDKLVLNPGYLFPEFNDKDNFLRTKGLFRNSKKLQFKLYSDIENPEYSQIFINPKIRWNNYDQFMLGARFHNQSLLTNSYKWYAEPKYSTGTGKLVGAAGIQNSFIPRKTVFRSITLGSNFKYEHYDQKLSFIKWAIYADLNFKKRARESLSHGFLMSFDHLDKEVWPWEVRTDADKYGLTNLTYYYSKPDYIHESHGSITFQRASTFQKLMGEMYYRWRFSAKKQLGVRLFVGAFIRQEADTDYFNFGVSRVSDYGFNLNMLGRSEASGLLSQQYFLAEAGFKSTFDFTVSQWVGAINAELPIWKMFDLYADAGVYRNKKDHSRFIYDSGIKVKLIPDFLEFYFPVQSSLGFEPARKNYLESIRFTFNFNLLNAVNHLRRGWY